MFDLINGLPVHPLVVHAVVVLLPLAILGAIAIAVRPSWAVRYGWLVVGVAVVACVFIPIATSSGEALEHRVGDPGEHAELGDQLIWFALPLLVLTVALVLLARRKEQGKPAVGPSFLPTAVAVLTVVAAVAAGVQVYRVGDSGARAAWGDQVSGTTNDGPPPGGPDGDDS
ncbi:DUF2231 domain-containing protein [Nocardioides sp. GY 10127]|uniref:DUF2231 domain-containing protein n=1 Tax=Nocardioides sp. GY 10127 TaxID=2569762 RepID=UPI0010A857B0|nr:DUF2231 domain-containing protein [Nocardioides sp. GY 10127]TIC79287.1 hypothetical protein E8D37_16930 [Nocardioides sp. GY 10127]